MLLTEAKNKFLQHIEGLGRSNETVRGYKNILDNLERYFANKYNISIYVDEINYEDLDLFIYYMKQKYNWQPNSLKKCHYTLKSFFGYLFRKEIIKKDISLHMDPIKGEQKERVYLTPKEINELIEVIEPPLIRIIVETLYYSGMRVSEALNLRLKDVNFEKGVFHVRKSKSKVDRLVPIHNELYDLLKEYSNNLRPNVSSDNFFATRRTGEVSRQYVDNKIREATKKLGWDKRVTPHTFRHSFASNLINKNKNLVHVQKLLGHADLRTTSVYTHSKMDELTDSINSLE